MPRMYAAALIAGAFILDTGMSAHAQKKYGPGVTDTEIKIGQTMHYSRPMVTIRQGRSS
jgi:hypothetical protein